MGFLVAVVSRIGWFRVFKTFVWGRWVFSMGLREEQEKVCLLGFLGFFFFFGYLFPKKTYRFMGLLEIGLFIGFMGLICWRIWI